MTTSRLSDADVEEMERLATRLLELCGNAMGVVGRPARRVRGPLTPEQKAEVEAKVQAYLKRQEQKQ